MLDDTAPSECFIATPSGGTRARGVLSGCHPPRRSEIQSWRTARVRGSRATRTRVVPSASRTRMAGSQCRTCGGSGVRRLACAVHYKSANTASANRLSRPDGRTCTQGPSRCCSTVVTSLQRVTTRSVNPLSCGQIVAQPRACASAPARGTRIRHSAAARKTAKP